MVPTFPYHKRVHDKRTSFQQAKASVLKLRVTNDCAERGVALVEEYNKILTADEEQKQFLILDVKEHRKRYPNVNKTTLGKMKENV
ncbi:Phosphoribosylformylglycinamidine synthase [Frankliniella fusca]|uniref:Phosphoribosylformylglycinamidine synthase n=1 Tax=Frankliniella fusca TaxID=407009 RepID=A0AAE1HQU9_9NEOP|nr:Phosphoribosylformylglycinamidine synthase [Frankliniella fusca]